MSTDNITLTVLVSLMSGAFLTGCLAYATLARLRGRLGRLEANYESSLQQYEERLGLLERTWQQTERAVGPRTGPAPEVVPSKRKRVIEMAECGMDRPAIASALQMQPVQVDLLLKLHALQAEQSDDARAGDPSAPSNPEARLMAKGAAAQP